MHRNKIKNGESLRFAVSGLLPDRVPPIQTASAVRAGHGPGGHATAAGLVSLFSAGPSLFWEGGGVSRPLFSQYCGASLLCLPPRRIVNDTYRTDLCLLYPPFMIALGADNL